MATRLILIDASGFIFRAYHALPPLTRGDGTPVGAVYGFCTMLSRVLEQGADSRIGVIFDTARRNFRHDFFPAYKANRPPPPEDLVPQFAIVREATRAFGLPVIEKEGFEADDLIASYAVAATKQGWSVTIISSDKDLMQLVNDHVQMQDPIKQTIIDRQSVVDKFGVPPEQVVDVQALCGDSVDHVPGVPGIGIKTAAQLITQFGDLETLLAQAATLSKPKQRENLIAYADQARLSQRLVRLADDVPLDVRLHDLAPALKNDDARKSFLLAQGFTSLVRRLTGGDGSSPSPRHESIVGPTPPPQVAETIPAFTAIDRSGYRMLNRLEDVAQFLNRARETGILAVDTETTSLTPAKARLVGISLACAPGEAVYIPLGHTTKSDLFGEGPDTLLPQLDIQSVMACLAPALIDPAILKVGHNIKYDLQLFMPHGIAITPIDDTLLLSYDLDGTRHGHGMDELSELFLGHTPIAYREVTGSGKKQISFDEVPIDTATLYAAEDADITLRLHALLKPRLVREHKVTLYEEIDRPLPAIVAAMEYAGIRIDPAILRTLANEFEAELTILETMIFEKTGQTFNLASPKQLGHVLFDIMGLPGGEKTKTGEWATSADILEDLAAQGHAIVDKILEHRQLAKLKSTYTDSLIASIHPATGRVHTSFSLAATTTGRFSSSDPNLQNIPIRTAAGRKIRRAFVAEKDHVLISVDYSQIELRLAAAIANIPALKESFQRGEDIHTRTASEVFGLPIEGVDADHRRQAKAINFGIIYGISGFGLAKQLGCDTAVAGRYIKQYMARFPELADYMERTKREALDHGFVMTALGRSCTINGMHDKNPARRNFAQRQAINAPLQGTAADLMRLAMGRIPSALKAAGLQARMLLQVHDELVLEAPRAEAADTAALVARIMEGTGHGLFDVPLVAESGIADNWADT